MGGDWNPSKLGTNSINDPPVNFEAVCRKRERETGKWLIDEGN
jgi:hypothetical protein